MKRTKLIQLSALLLVLLMSLFLLLLGKTHRLQTHAQRRVGVRATPPPRPLEVARSNAAPLILNFWKTNAALEQLSTNNAAFQEWGKSFMLRVANDHLSKVPLFGLKAPLQAKDVAIRTRLTISGAEIDLDTLDGKHGIYYGQGGISKAVAWEAEMTGLFRDPSKLEHFRDNIGPWSAYEARSAAQALVHAKGLDIRRMGGRPTPVVRPDTFNLAMPDGSVRPVTVFYTVRWLDAEAENADVVEIRFRRTATGDWAVTSWFQAPVGGNENEPTDFASLYDRFFSGK